MSLLAIVKGKGPSGFGYGSTAEEVTEGLDLKGKTMLVTGCNSGLGEETVRVLALRGARVFATARSVEKAREALAKVKGETVPFACELSEPSSVKACVDAVKAELAKSGKKLDAILCNAGVMALPALELSHGYEKQFFTNHVGHFVLVTGLEDVLADDARVVMTSSAAHASAPKGGIDFDNLKGERGYKSWEAYGRSKIANLYFARALAKRFEGTKRTANAVHPGVIQTNLGRHLPSVARFFFTLANPIALKDAKEGAATQVYVAAHPAAATITGRYWKDANVTEPRKDGLDMDIATKLWAKTEEIVREVA